jgi:hypothetical protein
MATNVRLVGYESEVRYSPSVMSSPSDGVVANNCYDSTLNVSGDTIEVTVKGDFPWRSNRPGFKDVTLNLSLRNKAEDADVKFFRQHAISGDSFFIGIIDNKDAPAAGYIIFKAIVTTANTAGDYQSSQDLTFEVKPAIVNVETDLKVSGSWGTGSGSGPSSYYGVFANEAAANAYYGDPPPDGITAVIAGAIKTSSSGSWT